jgi:hypothetical protein
MEQGRRLHLALTPLLVHSMCLASLTDQVCGFASQPISLPYPPVPLSMMHFLRETDQPANDNKDAGRTRYLWSWDTALSGNLWLPVLVR